MKSRIYIIVFFLFFLFPFSIFALNIEKWDIVKYNNIEFYVIKENGDSYTLLKKTPLTTDEVNHYGENHINVHSTIPAYINGQNIPVNNEAIDVDGYGAISYYTSDTCKSYISGNDLVKDTSGCKNDYASSDVKYVVDAWVSDKLLANDLVKDSSGYNVRLITEKELAENLSFDYTGVTVSQSGFEASYESPKWIKKNHLYGWTMSAYDDYNDYMKVISYGSVSFKNIVDADCIIPLINVKKDKVSLSSKYEGKVSTYYGIGKREYKKGDIVIYNNIKFYVLKDSKLDDPNVTLLKVEPLNREELENSGLNDINKVYGKNEDSNKYPHIAYYTSDDCKESTPNAITTDCKTDYNDSEIKYIIDNWGKKYLNSKDLSIDENDYTLRLLNRDDIYNILNYIDYDYSNNTMGSYNYIGRTEETPEFNLFNCWSMMTADDGDFVEVHDYDGSRNRYIFTKKAVYSLSGQVCPVVTILKKDSVVDKNENLEVEVEDTSSKNTKLYIFLGILAIIGTSVVSFSKRKA